jgi:RNA polymerase sigma factor (sigma-70 family)
MAKGRGLTQEEFNALLTWLGSEREEAGRKYEHIRRGLVKFFIWNGCGEAEDLADEAINRVARRVRDVAPGYVGDPALYFHGVAKNILLESRKVRRAQPLHPAQGGRDAVKEDEAREESERRFECMERCMSKLSGGRRQLITEYYQRDVGGKADSRKALADKLGLSATNLRVKAHRIRTSLLECIRECMSGAGRE